MAETSTLRPGGEWEMALNRPQHFLSSMSQLGHEETHALQQSPILFDHFVGMSEQSLRDRKAQGLGGGQVFETCVEPAARYFTKQQ